MIRMYWLVFLIIPMGLGFLAQAWVKSAFANGSKVQSTSGLTGAQVSRRLLDSGGLSNVGVEGIAGSLSDHYDPRAKVMRLSQPVGNSSSVAAIAVAAHETGHAFQDAKGEATFRLRSALVPAANFASRVWIFPFILGAFTGGAGASSGNNTLIYIAIALFASVVAFSVITLPVEFGASRRAMQMLTAQGIITPQEAPVARKVLTAAAFTYIVAALVSIVQIVYLLGLARR